MATPRWDDWAATLRDELRRHDERRQHLAAMLEHAEALVRSERASVSDAALEETSRPTRQVAPTETPRGPVAGSERRAALQTPSVLKPAVLRVLREARGEPLHVKTIGERVVASGVQTNAKNVDKLMHTVAQRLERAKEPVEHLGNRLWRWTEGIDGAASAAGGATGQPVSEA